MAAVSLLWAWFYRMRRGNQVTVVSALANVALVAEAGLALALRTHPERRAGALRDGVLIDVSTVAREAGITYPVALTRAAWERCVTVPPGVEGQDEAGRLWDVLWLLRLAVGRSDGGSEVRFGVHVRDDNREGTPPMVRLKALCGPGDQGEPVLTVMLPDED